MNLHSDFRPRVSSAIYKVERACVSFGGSCVNIESIQLEVFAPNNYQVFDRSFSTSYKLTVWVMQRILNPFLFKNPLNHPFENKNSELKSG